MKKIRIIESKGARKLVLMRREDFDFMVAKCNADIGYQEIEVVAKGGQLQGVGDESFLLEDQKS